ncbi:MAG: HD-GYP domain-containing protein [Fimbriimonadaceae bacterium]
MVQHPSKAQILAALSKALDLVEGQPDGHAVRTCALSSRIGRVFGLSERELSDLFFVAILKDCGCSNNSVRLQKIFGGDEVLMKREVKLIDWTSTTENVKFAFAHTEPGKNWIAKLRRLSSNLGTPKSIMDEVTQARCTRGAAIARKLGCSEAVATGIHSLDEHWDGKGSPYGFRGDSVPILSRIVCLAQTFEVFLLAFGLEEAIEMLRGRSGSWFDPDLVDVCISFKSDIAFWESVGDATYAGIVPDALHGSAIDADVDAICEAFAMIIDAKSSFTAEHSTRVAEYAVMIGRELGFCTDQLVELRRTGLLHDIGKLAVSSSILEKPGKLDADEFAVIRSHPKHSFEILNRIESFSGIADIASAHHERLDGTGYWQGLGAEQLSLEMRIMTVADVFDALSAKRPYRDAMPYEKCQEIMEKDSGTAFDPECLEALWSVFARESRKIAA